MTYRPDRGVFVLTRNLAGLRTTIARIEARGQKVPSYLRLWEANYLKGIQHRSLLNATRGPAPPPAGMTGGVWATPDGGWTDAGKDWLDSERLDAPAAPSGNAGLLAAAALAALALWGK